MIPLGNPFLIKTWDSPLARLLVQMPEKIRMASQDSRLFSRSSLISAIVGYPGDSASAHDVTRINGIIRKANACMVFMKMPPSCYHLQGTEFPIPCCSLFIWTHSLWDNAVFVPSIYQAHHALCRKDGFCAAFNTSVQVIIYMYIILNNAACSFVMIMKALQCHGFLFWSSVSHFHQRTTNKSHDSFHSLFTPVIGANATSHSLPHLI